MSVVTKSIIWAEIEVIDAVLVMAKNHGMTEAYPFVQSLLELKRRFTNDLIEETK